QRDRTAKRLRSLCELEVAGVCHPADGPPHLPYVLLPRPWGLAQSARRAKARENRPPQLRFRFFLPILLKNPLGFFSFFRVGPLADEPEFVTSINFPLHHFTGVDINGSRQRQRQVHITLRDGLFASDGLDFSGVVHGFPSLVNKID